MSQVTEEQVRMALRTVIEPSLGLSVVDLGLVAWIRVVESDVEVLLACRNLPEDDAQELATRAKAAIGRSVRGVGLVDVRCGPQEWAVERMSETARRFLGLVEPPAYLAGIPASTRFAR